MNTYQIEQINYQLIRNAHNLTFKEKNLLLGHPNKFVATQITEDGLVIFTETIGKRNDCVEALRQMVGLLEMQEMVTEGLEKVSN